jgi:hypothetical protein
MSTEAGGGAAIALFLCGRKRPQRRISLLFLFGQSVENRGVRFLFRKRTRFSIQDLWDIWQGLLAVVCLAFLAYRLGMDAVEDRNTRLVLAATILVIAVVGGLGLLWRRYRARRPG